MLKKLIILTLILELTHNAFSQNHINQNGLQTTVIGTLYANATQARRFEIATIAYNSYHWQHGGLVIIELYNQYFGTGYEKYIIENGFGQGANSGVPVIKLVETYGMNHHAKLVLGDAYDLSSNYGGYVNRALPIFLDIRYYAGYKIRLTYLQDKVDNLTWSNQIKINESPTPIDISDFTVSTQINTTNDIVSSGNLRITGLGDHYIQNGNLGIGTTTPKNLLDVKGTIHAQEVKVDMNNWSDFVFHPSYQLKPLTEVEKFIKANGHLQDIPSATEVEQNGVNVGEMQKKLLQKVEELTLYTIEQNKKLEEQNKKLEKQAKINTMLLKRIEEMGKIK